MEDISECQTMYKGKEGTECVFILFAILLSSSSVVSSRYLFLIYTLYISPEPKSRSWNHRRLHLSVCILVYIHTTLS